MQLHRYATMAAVVLTAAATIQTPPARAATSAANAVGSCQGSLYTYDANLRKRPLAIRNEGTASAFVSCAGQHGYYTYSTQDAVLVATNGNAHAVDLTCTAVVGMGLVEWLHWVDYFPETISIAGNSSASVVWQGHYAPYGFNFTCNLPPGVEINTVGYDYTPIES